MECLSWEKGYTGAFIPILLYFLMFLHFWSFTWLVQKNQIQNKGNINLLIKVNQVNQHECKGEDE